MLVLASGRLPPHVVQKTYYMRPVYFASKFAYFSHSSEDEMGVACGALKIHTKLLLENLKGRQKR
jgi:hypothetical protein